MVGNGENGDSKSQGYMIEPSTGCGERSWVPHGGRLPRGGSVYQAGGDADVALGELGPMLEAVIAFCALGMI